MDETEIGEDLNRLATMEEYRSDISTEIANQPVRRTDDLGVLAWKLMGTRATGPDFSAAMPLADEITQQYGHQSSLVFQLSVSLLANEFAGVAPENVSSRDTLRRMNNVLRRTVALYLYDFGSAVTSLGSLVDRVRVPEPPPEVRTASVELVWFKLPGVYDIGDRVRVGANNDLYVVVVPPGDDQKTGLARVENNEPTMAMSSSGEGSGD